MLSGDDGHGERLEGEAKCDTMSGRRRRVAANKGLQGRARCGTMSKCELQGNVNYRRRARRQDERIKSRGAEEEDSGQLCGAMDNGSRMSQQILRASNK